MLGRVLRAVGDLLDRVTSSVGNGLLARVLVLLVVLLVVGLALIRLGPLRRRAAGPGALFGSGRTMTGDEHRAAADALAGAGRWAEAVRERLRAVVRDLEQGGVLDPRPGRTAGEVARDGGRAVPALAADLGRAATLFDEVWYGGRPAGPDSYAVLVEVDRRVRSARTVAP